MSRLLGMHRGGFEDFLGIIRKCSVEIRDMCTVIRSGGEKAEVQKVDIRDNQTTFAKSRKPLLTHNKCDKSSRAFNV
jgi:hypothetical protein